MSEDPKLKWCEERLEKYLFWKEVARMVFWYLSIPLIIVALIVSVAFILGKLK